MRKNKDTYKLIVILIALIIITAPYLLTEYKRQRSTEKVIDKLEVVEEYTDPFASLDLEAKSVYVFDIESGESLYSINEDVALPLASLTKVMTAIVATDLVPQSTVVTIESDDIREEGDSGLLVGERWRMSDIIDFTLTTSSNDGASAIASVAGSLGERAYTSSTTEAKIDFADEMNLKTQELGLFDTYFFNATGLDLEENSSGSYGTARDVAKLMAYAIKNKIDVIGSTSRARFVSYSLNSIAHTATNTNKSIANIPGLIASKTGFTDLAGGNLVVVFDAGIMRPIVISVLGSSREGRFTDMEKLVWASLKSL